MKMLSGYLEPNQGQISVDSQSIQQHLLQVQKHLGYLPENLPLYPEISVADYLDYVADIKGLAGDHKISELRRVISATELDTKLLAPIATLSRGYKQRVGVAQAILGKPRLLILDEPTNGLDPTQTELMRQLIRDISKEATVILSTHIMQEVEALCDRVLILSQGKLAVDARLDELKVSNQILLHTSMPTEKMSDLSSLAGVEAVEGVEQAENQPVDDTEGHEYRVFINQPQREVCARLANHLINAGYDLFSLTPEHRDLETLFREVSDARVQPQVTQEMQNVAEVQHAA